MPLKTLKTIAEYARLGGIVIATGRVPSLAPGFLEAKTDTAKIREMAGTLFEGQGARGHLVKDDAKLGETLHGLLQPDVKAPPEIGFVHRKLPSVDVYFLANTANHRVHVTATFREGSAGESWDPFTGAVGSWALRRSPPGAIELDMAPYESRVFICPSGAFSILGPGTEEPSGPALVLLDLSAGWKTTFAGSSEPVTMDSLSSWTEVAGMKNFSGTAVYEKTIHTDAKTLAEWTAITIAGRRRLYLDFGEGTPVTTPERRGSGMRALLESPVREVAIVYVNGKRAGSVWHPPYEVEITGMLHSGENTLRIEVANLAINALAAQPLPDYRGLIAKYGDRFQDQDMKNIQPLPAGILGTVRIVSR
jgi:hypothetical protein